MTIKDFVDYFENVAKGNKIISHATPQDRVAFKRIDIEDVINGIRSDLEGVSMYLESPEIKPADALSDNPRKLFKGAFLIMKPVDVSDVDQILEALDICQTVCDQILAKILNDLKKHKINSLHPFKIKGFNVGSVDMQKVGPIFGNSYGYRFTFTLDQTFTSNLILDQADWYSDTPFKI
jgi:hypothetical protein